MNFTVTKSVLELHRFCTKTWDRPSLVGIYLDGEGYAVATDGCMMAVLKCEIPAEANGTFIPAELVKRALKMMPKGTDSVTCEVNKETLSLSSSGVFVSADVDPAIQFPDWRVVMPEVKPTSEWVPFTVNPEFFGRIAQYLKACKEELVITCTCPADELSPMLFVNAILDVQFIIMPMRL